MVDDAGAVSSAAWISPPGCTVAAHVTAAWLAVTGTNIRVRSETEAMTARLIEARRMERGLSLGGRRVRWYVPLAQG